MYNLLTKIYRAANDKGWLDTKLGNKIFTSAYFFYKRNFEDSYVRLFKEKPQILSGGNAIDVGANIGYTGILFAQYIEDNYKIFAIEPHPLNFQKLKDNLTRFRKNEKVVAIQSAVGNHDGEITLWENPISHADHRILTDSFEDLLEEKKTKSLNVPIITLDSLVAERKLDNEISFIKIDVQGYEIPVLEGMRQILKNNPQAKVCLEFDPAMIKDMGFNPMEIFDFFPDYKVYSLTHNKVQKFELSKQSDDGGQIYVDLLFSRKNL